MDDEDEVLEYDVYGHFKFSHEPAGVFAIGPRRAPVEHAAGQCIHWEAKKAEFDGRTDKLSEPFE